MLKHRQYIYFNYIFSRATLKRPSWLNMIAFCAEHPKRDDEHPHLFHMRSPPPGREHSEIIITTSFDHEFINLYMHGILMPFCLLYVGHSCLQGMQILLNESASGF